MCSYRGWLLHRPRELGLRLCCTSEHGPLRSEAQPPRAPAQHQRQLMQSWAGIAFMSSHSFGVCHGRNPKAKPPKSGTIAAALNTNNEELHCSIHACTARAKRGRVAEIVSDAVDTLRSSAGASSHDLNEAARSADDLADAECALSACCHCLSRGIPRGD